MKTLKSSAVQAKFGYVLDMAKSGEHVIITQYDRPSVVMMSYAYYQQAEEALRLQAGNRMETFLNSLPTIPDAEKLSDEDINDLVHELRP